MLTMKYVYHGVPALTSTFPFSAKYYSIEKRKQTGGKHQHKMKKTIAAISIAVIGSLACPVLLSAEENEEAVQMKDLPAAVQTTIKAKAGTNELVKIEKKTEKGKTVYEAVINKKGTEWSIEVDANGKFLKQYKESEEKEEKGEKY
jgi:uncharacterized membrane protein YkoI